MLCLDRRDVDLNPRLIRRLVEAGDHGPGRGIGGSAAPDGGPPEGRAGRERGPVQGSRLHGHAMDECLVVEAQQAGDEIGLDARLHLILREVVEGLAVDAG